MKCNQEPSFQREKEKNDIALYKVRQQRWKSRISEFIVFRNPFHSIRNPFDLQSIPSYILYSTDNDLSIYSIHPSIHPCIHQSIHPSINPSIVIQYYGLRRTDLPLVPTATNPDPVRRRHQRPIRRKRGPCRRQRYCLGGSPLWVWQQVPSSTPGGNSCCVVVVVGGPSLLWQKPTRFPRVLHLRPETEDVPPEPSFSFCCC